MRTKTRTKREQNRITTRTKQEQNFKDLQEMAEDSRRESLLMGLSINLAKTKVMTNIKNLGTLNLDGEKIEQVEDNKYLEQTLSFENKTEKEIKIRRANGWKFFWAQKTILKSKLKLKSKIKIFESTIIPVLTYGAQTWATTKKQIGKI